VTMPDRAWRGPDIASGDPLGIVRIRGMPKRSVIVKFGSQKSRDAFLERVAGIQPALKSHMFLPKRRADAIVDDLSESEHELVVELVGDDGEVFEDVKFETMSAPGQTTTSAGDTES